MLSKKQLNRLNRYNPIRWLFIGIIKFYQWFISPIIGPRCRFYPTCSHYALEAINTHGVICGGWLALKRIFRCHPANPGGVDMVPTYGCDCAKPDLAETAESNKKTAKEPTNQTTEAP